MRDIFYEALDQMGDAKLTVAKLHEDRKTLETLFKMAMQTAEEMKVGGRLFMFGNGGSASDCAHIRAEFTGNLDQRRPALPAFDLSSNPTYLTAWSNDDEYRNIFERQVECMVGEGDVVIGLTTSGRSENVLRGLGVAQTVGATVFGWTGQMKTTPECTRLQSSCCRVLRVPSSQTMHIQECHIICGHIFVSAVEKLLFPELGL